MVRVKKQTLMQFILYNIGGFLYFWSAWTIITFGEKHIGLWWANIIGNGVGISLNYIFQRFVAFKKSKKDSASTWKFAVLTGVNLVLSYFILKGLVAVGIPLWLAQFGSAGFFTGWNWVWYRVWVFRKK